MCNCNYIVQPISVAYKINYLESYTNVEINNMDYKEKQNHFKELAKLKAKYKRKK